jgi:PAS domain S-box-containing protein
VPLSTQPKRILVPSRGHRPTITVQPRKPEKSAAKGYQELFQSIYDAGVITDLRGRIRDVNRRAVEFFGRDVEELQVMNVGDVVSGVTEPLVRTLYENLQHERFTLMQAYCLRADKTSFPTEIAVSMIRLPMPHLCFFIRDVTVRRQAEEMLRTEHNALQNASDAIVVTDLDGHVEYANPATAHIWGYQSQSDLIGASFGSLLAHPDDAQIIISSLSGETYHWKGEAVAQRASGEQFRVAISGSCNRDSDGEVVGAVFSLSDLSAWDREALAQQDIKRHRAAITDVRAHAARLTQLVTARASHIAGLDEELLADIKTIADNLQVATDEFQRD